LAKRIERIATENFPRNSKVYDFAYHSGARLLKLFDP